MALAQPALVVKNNPSSGQATIPARGCFAFRSALPERHDDRTLKYHKIHTTRDAAMTPRPALDATKIVQIQMSKVVALTQHCRRRAIRRSPLATCNRVATQSNRAQAVQPVGRRIRSRRPPPIKWPAAGFLSPRPPGFTGSINRQVRGEIWGTEMKSVGAVLLGPNVAHQ